MKRNIPPWPKLATVQYWILSLILYLISIFALFAVPYPQFSNGMAALKCSPHSRNYNHIHAHLGLFSLCFATEWDWKSYLAQIQFVVSLLYPITGLSRLTRPRHGRLLTGRHSTLYTDIVPASAYPHPQHQHPRFLRSEQFHLSLCIRGTNGKIKKLPKNQKIIFILNRSAHQWR